MTAEFILPEHRADSDARAATVSLELPRCGSAPSNRELIEQCDAGDVDAWNELVARYERLVYAIPMREGLSEHDAADISQATFEALIESLDRIRQPERLGYWLMTVCRRLTWMRRTSSSFELSMGTDLPELPSEDPTSRWERTVAVYDAVATLDEPCRSLITSLFFDPAEPSYAEISHELGYSIGSLGPLRGRCLDRLRRALDEVNS